MCKDTRRLVLSETQLPALPVYHTHSQLKPVQRTRTSMVLTLTYFCQTLHGDIPECSHM